MPLAEAESWLAERRTELSLAEADFVQASVDLRERQAAERERQLVQASIGLASQALLELESTSPERAVLLALEALGNYPYTWQAEPALGQAVLNNRLRLILRHGAVINSVFCRRDAHPHRWRRRHRTGLGCEQRGGTPEVIGS